MWRLVALASVGLAIGLSGALLPPLNGEEQLRSLTHIAIRGSDDGQTASMPTKSIPTPATLSLPEPSGAALAPTAAPLLDDASEPQGSIVTQLQEQLRRVGCFKGKVLGRWDAATRRAMARFNDRVNAHQPLDAPSPVLLTLVEKYDNRACGAPCGPGNSPNAAGVCVSTRQVAIAIPLPAVGDGLSLATLAPITPGKENQVRTKPVALAIAAAPAPLASQSVAAVANSSNDWAPAIIVSPVATKAGPLATRLAAAPILPKPALPTPIITAPRFAPRPAAAADSAIATELPMVVMTPGTPSSDGVAPAAAPESGQRTTLAVLNTRHKKRARKSSGSGNTLFALGGPARSHRHVGSSNWLTALLSGQMFVTSNRFVAGPRPSFNSPSNGEPQIVFSNH